MAKIDRRVARTRAQLQRACMSLILQRGYEATTVEDICRAADVGRSTFYAHYAGKEDLKRAGLENLKRELIAHEAVARTDNAGPAWLDFSRPMFEHARDHLDLYRALAGGRGGETALGAIRQILSDRIRTGLVEDGVPADGTPRELVVQHLVGAYMAVLTWWLDGGAKLPPEAIDAAFRRLAAEGVASTAA